jgi:hypothetical protein
MNLPAGLPITSEDWEKTPPGVQTLVIMLWEENQILKTPPNHHLAIYRKSQSFHITRFSPYAQELH